MNITAFDIAQRFIGTKEVAGGIDNPMVMAMLKLDNDWPENDEVPWCSAFANYVCWLLRLPRSKSLRARSWLLIGKALADYKKDAQPGYDIVILKRGKGEQPGPDVIEAPGHVGFFAGWVPGGELVEVVGGNQGDQVKMSRYKISDILGVRRLRDPSLDYIGAIR